MSSNHLFTYTKTDNAFVTLELCKLHKIDMSYLCIFDDVVYISMRIEIAAFPEEEETRSRCSLHKYED